jgi:DNA-binding protein HU-beta
MNKTDLINKVAEATETTKKEATQSVEAVLSVISDALGAGGLEILKSVSVLHVKDAIRKLVKKLIFLQ